MAPRSIDPEALKAQIEALPGLCLAELRSHWATLYGNPAPRSLRRYLLIRAVAYQLQVRAYGGLSTATKRRLREIARAAREGTFGQTTLEPRIRPGTRLIRVWQGETHSVVVHEDGFEWNGSRHRSLSTIAKAITGTSWNGWTFFGVKRAKAGEGRDAAGRFKSGAAPDGMKHWPGGRRPRANKAATDA